MTWNVGEKRPDFSSCFPEKKLRVPSSCLLVACGVLSCAFRGNARKLAWNERELSPEPLFPCFVSRAFACFSRARDDDSSGHSGEKSFLVHSGVVSCDLDFCEYFCSRPSFRIGQARRERSARPLFYAPVCFDFCRRQGFLLSVSNFFRLSFFLSPPLLSEVSTRLQPQCLAFSLLACFRSLRSRTSRRSLRVSGARGVCVSSRASW